MVPNLLHMLGETWQGRRNTVQHTEDNSSFVGRTLGRDKEQLYLLKLQQINHYSAEFPVQRKAGARR
jgi:hypothetical protein